MSELTSLSRCCRACLSDPVATAAVRVPRRPELSQRARAVAHRAGVRKGGLPRWVTRAAHSPPAAPGPAPESLGTFPGSRLSETQCVERGGFAARVELWLLLSDPCLLLTRPLPSWDLHFFSRTVGGVRGRTSSCCELWCRAWDARPPRIALMWWFLPAASLPWSRLGRPPVAKAQ